MTTRRGFFAGLTAWLVPTGLTKAATTTDPQTQAVLDRICLTQGWGLVHGSHYTGPQPGIADRYHVRSNIDRDEVRNLDAMRAIIDRDNTVDQRRRMRALTGTPTRTIRITPAGDSITVGVGGLGDGYRGWLAAELDRYDITAQGLDTVAGGNGATLDALAGPINAAFQTAIPDFVVLAVGTNDSAWGDPATFPDRYGRAVDDCLRRSPTLKVVCCTIAYSHERADPVRANPTVTTNQHTINTAITAVAAARPGRTALADMSTLPSTWLHDGGWHPGNAGYALMGRTIANTIRNAL